MQTEQIGPVQQTEVLSGESVVTVDVIQGLQLADYELEERIGSGGYGEVWRAIGPGGLPKAVKVLYGERHGEHAEAEMKALERMRHLRHPFLLNIERIEVVNSRLIVVTELADGNLAQRFDEFRAQGKPGIPRDQLLDFLKDAADALDFMSEQHGLQHLDIKPDNILLQGNHAKVGDFGLAKDINVTNVSVVNGFTPLYAPPELFEGRPGRTSDQYSLAIVYQVMLTGKTPFSGRTAAQLTAQHLRSQPDLTDLQPIDRPVIARALSKNMNSRYDNCRQFVDELARRKHARSTNTAFVPVDLDSELSRTALVKTQGTQNSKSLLRKASTPVRTAAVASTGQTLRPSVFIGVGGIAGAVMRQLKIQVMERQPNSTTAVFPILQIDTNRSALSALRGAADEPGLSAEETIAIPLRSSKEYRSAAELDLSWLSRRWLFNIPRSGQVDGIRPLGRLALFDHRKNVEARLTAVLDAAGSVRVREAAENICELPMTDNGIDVYVVGATSGGTSSGTIADIGLMIRRIAKQRSMKGVQIHGVLMHGTGAMRNITDVQEANTACALKELRHLSTPGLGTNRGFDNDTSMQDVAPFDDTYFVHFGDGLSTHAYASRAEGVAKYLLQSASTAAQLDFRNWRECTEDEYKSPEQLRMIGVGTQDAQSFEVASAQSADLCSLLLRRWCGSGGLTTPDQQHEIPAELTDSLTLLTELQLTSETLPRQVMALLRGKTGREIEAYASEVNDRLVATIDPATATREEILANISQQLSTQQTNDDQVGRSLHGIVSNVQSTLKAATGNCETAITAHISKLLDTPHRLGGALAAAKFVLASLNSTCQSCAGLVGEIESKFNGLAVEGDPKTPLLTESQEDPAEQVKAFCRQYCVLLAYQTIYQCHINHIIAIRKTVDTQNSNLHALKDKLTSLASGMASSSLLSDFVPQPVVDAFDRHLRTTAPELLENYALSEKDCPDFASGLTESAIQFMVGAARSQDGFDRQESVTDQFPANVWPEIKGSGGRRRVLGLLPACVDDSYWKKQLKDEFGDCVATREVSDGDVTVVCEIEGVPIDAVFGHLTRDNPHIADVASRIHTRTDVEW